MGPAERLRSGEKERRLVAGFRYGEGTLYTKNARFAVYWQGPSVASLGWPARVHHDAGQFLRPVDIGAGLALLRRRLRRRLGIGLHLLRRRQRRRQRLL